MSSCASRQRQSTVQRVKDLPFFASQLNSDILNIYFFCSRVYFHNGSCQKQQCCHYEPTSAAHRRLFEPKINLITLHPEMSLLWCWRIKEVQRFNAAADMFNNSGACWCILESGHRGTSHFLRKTAWMSVSAEWHDGKYKLCEAVQRSRVWLTLQN